MQKKKIKTEEEHFEERFPERVKKARDGSRKQAIHNHCYICIGSSQEAAKCPSKTCSLWPFRPGAK